MKDRDDAFTAQNTVSPDRIAFSLSVRGGNAIFACSSFLNRAPIFVNVVVLWVKPSRINGDAFSLSDI
jgi:hypothetical protein